MPRIATPENDIGRQKTERWRQKRRARGRPEASIVDRAIAASFAAFFTRDLDTDVDHGDYHAILLGARRILVDRGFDKIASNNELMQRLTRRNDLSTLAQITGAYSVVE